MPRMFSGWRMASLAALSIVWSVGPAAAQPQYPSRPITLLTPAPPGGGLDTVARQLAETTQRLSGMQLVVENKVGAGGTIAIRDVVNAKPDGYTLAFVTNTPLTMAHHTMPVPYTIDSYRPLIRVNTLDNALCVAPAFPANTTKEFIEHLARNPGRYSYGVDAAGGILHVTVEHTFRKLEIQATAVPFGGGQVTLTNFLGGHIDIFGGGLPSILPHVASGQAKCLLVTSTEPNGLVPQASGLAGVGITDINGQLWFGAIAPRDTPQVVVDKLSAAFTQAARERGMSDTLARIGGSLAILGPQEFRELIVRESNAFGTVIRTLDLKL